jgi:DNA-binding transcriptional LysR family regulator
MDHMLAVTAFIYVVTEGSFAAASKELRMPEAEIEAAIAELEDAVDMDLIHRTGDKVSPTENGERFLLRSLQFMDEMREELGNLKPRMH